MENKTAVSWLIDQINSRKCWADPNQLEPLIKQAKQMEKEQIKTAWIAGDENGYHTTESSMDYETEGRGKHLSEQYYTQTYENESSANTKTYHAFKGELIQDEIGNLIPKNHGK